jgi:hypothetical protein
VGHVPAAAVVADAEACGDVLGDGSEALDDALADRLERLVPRRAARSPVHSAGRWSTATNTAT